MHSELFGLFFSHFAARTISSFLVQEDEQRDLIRSGSVGGHTTQKKETERCGNSISERTVHSIPILEGKISFSTPSSFKLMLPILIKFLDSICLKQHCWEQHRQAQSLKWMTVYYLGSPESFSSSSSSLPLYSYSVSSTNIIECQCLLRNSFIFLLDEAPRLLIQNRKLPSPLYHMWGTKSILFQDLFSLTSSLLIPKCLNVKKD